MTYDRTSAKRSASRFPSYEDGSAPVCDGNNLERDKSQDQVVGVTRATPALESVNLASAASSIANMGRRSRTHKAHDSIRQTMSIKGDPKIEQLTYYSTRILTSSLLLFLPLPACPPSPPPYVVSTGSGAATEARAPNKPKPVSSQAKLDLVYLGPLKFC